VTSRTVDFLIVGGGFYGCCLALFLRSLCKNVVVVEAGSELMTRASGNNQARIHTGFHYPRSVLTAARSIALHRRFVADFPGAVFSDFQMLYAVPRHRSQVSAKRFYRMFTDMGAPIAPARAAEAALFDPDRVDAVFAVQEFAFDHEILRQMLRARLAEAEIDVLLGVSAVSIVEREGFAVASLSSGEDIHARQIFNVTYSGINRVLRSAGLPEAEIKYELAEIALVEVPAELERYGLTIVDGPFFSCMPHPASGLHSLSHVRYTPHASWTDRSRTSFASEAPASAAGTSNHRHMILDARRYVPALGDARWQRSIFETKAVLVRNEHDDGRPILFRQQPPASRIISVMGGKIDNVYDLFDRIRQARPEWSEADERHFHGG